MACRAGAERAGAVIGKLALAWLCAGLLWLIPTLSWAHAFAPVLLELKEWPNGRVDVLWKVATGTSEAEGDGAGAGGPPIRLQFPAHCHPEGPRQASREPAALLERWTLDCGGSGLAGQTITLAGLVASGHTAVIRYSSPSGDPPVAMLLEQNDALVLAPRAGTQANQGGGGSTNVALSYLKLGIEHIALGVDHLLFVLCLMLWVRRPKPIAAAVTAFTAAHSLTLALAVLDVVRLEAPPVEALIAFSIVLLAGRVAVPAPALPRRERPFAMAFAFGLLHGLGFAGALLEAGVPQGQISLALLCFNLGVEIGQIAFVAGLLAAAWMLPRALERHAPQARRMLAYAAGSAGAFFFVDRVAGFWPS